jgi:hypothetical protein
LVVLGRLVETVLVVGVEAACCEAACSRLRARGVSVYCTNARESAYARLVSQPTPDVIVAAGAFSDIAIFARKVTPSAAVVVIGGETLTSDRLFDAILDSMGVRLGRSPS